MVEALSLLLAGYVGWLLWVFIKIYPQDAELPESAQTFPATLLVAFRNEEIYLSRLFNTLLKEESDVQIIAIDDGSTDRSAEIAQKYAVGVGDTRLRYLLNTEKPGKRGAIAFGTSQANTDLILQTDADCLPPANWVQQTVRKSADTQAAMLIQPLRFRSERLSKFWLSVINTEFASVMAVTCAMARAKRPVMCNGANLTYRKSLFEAAAPALASQTHAGGDDMFLLDYAVTHGYPIAYNDAAGAWVETEAPESWTAFIRQRRRWAAKWSAYRSPWPYAVAAVTLLGQWAFALCIGLLCFGSGNIWLATLAGGKMLIEGLLLRRQMQKGTLSFQLLSFLFWQVAYLPYVLATALPSLWQRRPVTWKS